MRTFSGLTAAAVLALTIVGLPGAGQAAPDASGDTPGPLAALLAHRSAALENESTGFRVVGTVTDADGTTHTRMVRTWGGLAGVGGDLVVHQGAAGGWDGVSQTLAAPLQVATTPAVSADA